jgi:hypothetical protein
MPEDRRKANLGKLIALLIFVASFYLRTTSGAKWIVSVPMLPFILSLIGVVGLAMPDIWGASLSSDMV